MGLNISLREVGDKVDSIGMGLIPAADRRICKGVSSPRKGLTSRKVREKWGTPIIYDAGEVGHPLNYAESMRGQGN